jgi:hydroxymethylglutaryl-CoA lyase
MSDRIKIVECPRDAWQGLQSSHAQIPPARKAHYLRQLIAAGFTHIDAVSFVSPAAVPQMADSEEVLRSLDLPDAVEIIGIVLNARGAERAIRTGKVGTLGFAYSISAEFLQRNQNQTPAKSLEILHHITSLAAEAALGVVAYVSMAFGNPYGEPWSIAQVVDACGMLTACGIRQISLADTVGMAAPKQISELFSAVTAAHSAIELGVHLHARPDAAASRIRAAYKAGCRRFDSAIGGLGGCPFAQEALVGNIPTEILLEVLRGLGAQVPPLELSDSLMYANAEIAREFSSESESS